MVTLITVATILSDDANIIGLVVGVDELGRGIGGISSAHHETIKVIRLSFSSATRRCVR